jgi:SAM-dependent methyltransferase
MNKIAAIDEAHLRAIRKNVRDFMVNCSHKWDKQDALILDIAPQDHEGAAPYFTRGKIETLDIDKNSGATYIADLCENNEKIIPANHFDYIVCTEVLEHTLQPFAAVKEIERLLKSGGFVFVSAPFNFRIHGPLPDCWRFTEHGLKALFKDFEIVELNTLETKDRFLMPTHYTLIVRKK